MRSLLVVVLVLVWSSIAAAEGEPAERHEPVFGVGLDRMLTVDEYLATITSVHVGGPVRRVPGVWAFAAYGTGSAGGYDAGDPVTEDSDLNEGMAGAQYVSCKGPACWGAILGGGYQREHHTDFDGLVQETPWEVRRHRWFTDGRVLGRLWVAKWAALDVGLGLRANFATVHRHSASADTAPLAYIGVTLTP